jgi:COMPASS component SWD3
MASGKCTHTIKEEHDNDLYALDFSPDGRLFAVAGLDTKVYIYDEQTKAKLHVMTEGPGHHPGHSNRVFAVKFHPTDSNVLLSGGWDRTIQIYDLRAGMVVDSIFGPEISGDALDVYEDMILAGSNRNKDVIQMFSLSKRSLIQTVEWEASSKKDLETGFIYGAKFSKPSPQLIFAGGAGRNEVKVFENNIDGSASMRILASINEFDSPALCLDTSKNGETFAFGCQTGQIYIVSYKIDDLIGDFEGYQGQFSMEKGKEFLEQREAAHHQ